MSNNTLVDVVSMPVLKSNQRFSASSSISGAISNANLVPTVGGKIIVIYGIYAEGMFSSSVDSILHFYQTFTSPNTEAIISMGLPTSMVTKEIRYTPATPYELSVGTSLAFFASSPTTLTGNIQVNIDYILKDA